MSREDKSLSGLPVSGSIVAIALLLGLGFVSQISFHPSRPKQSLHVKEAALEGENIQARLWQDPFEAIARHEKAYPETKVCQGQQIDAFAQQIVNKGAKEIVVLGVMVFGGPYAEEAETRTRYRYAALSALGRLKYVPEDELHLGSLKDPLEPVGGPKVIPYEWFERTSEDEPDAPKKILVLWLNDDNFFPEPLMRLGQLMHILEEAVCQKSSASNRPQLILKVLGPAGSRNLKAMFDEVSSDFYMYPCGATAEFRNPKAMFDEVSSNCGRGKWPVYFDMYSWGSTAEFGADKEALFRDWCFSRGNCFIRTIGTDGALIDALLEELRLRDADPVPEEALDSDDWQEPASVALISEWDTFYGRSLPETFVRKIKARYEHEFPRKKIEESKIHEWVYPFSYMRGLDGALPEPTTSGSPTATTQETRQSDTRKETVERPEGNSQFDYLRRLARQLRQLDTESRRKGKPGIRAIGVLGGDVYDKLLVLQAMYRLFPNVIFFTTDLDARLLHPEEMKWTRNLVVASCYGLRLNRDLQKNIPPFRDTYQTSLFFSTLLALSGNSNELGPEKVKHWLGHPRIFEVGKSGAFDLSAKKEASDKEDNSDNKENSEDILNQLRGETIVSEGWLHPSTDEDAHVLRFWWVVSASLLFIGICLAFYYRPQGREEPRIPWRIVCLVGYPLLVAGILYGVITSQGGGVGEPLSFTEGISIWPTEFLRFLIAGLTFYFIFCVCRKTRESDRTLSAYFEPETTSGSDGGDIANRSESQKRLSTLWRIHKIRCRPKRRWCRVLLLSAGYSVLCTFIIRIGPPAVPFRGDPSWWVDRLALFFCVPLFIVLVFWVVDATREAVWLISGLQGEETDWPQSTKDREPRSFRTSEAGLNEWITIRMVVDLTETLNRFIYYPVIIILLLGVSRLRYFDNWHLPVGLLVVMLLGLALSLYCAISLRRASEASRQRALDALWIELLEAKTAKPDQKGVSDGIEMIRTRIRDIRKGALVPFLEQPWVRALAIFLSGGGSLLLLELLP